MISLRNHNNFITFVTKYTTMEDSNTLVKLFNIEIPVYTGYGEKKREENLYDSELCNDIIRLYFLEKIKRVIIKTRYRDGEENVLYYYEKTDGETAGERESHVE